jgi:hypothetical protein
MVTGEDVWGSDEEGAGPGAAASGAAPRSPASAVSGSGSSRGEDEEDETPRVKMETIGSESAAEGAATGEADPATSPPLLRLRLNASLCTDPAQRKDISQV